MSVLLVSENEAITSLIRELSTRAGLKCPPSCVVSPDVAATHVSKHRLDLIVVVLSPAPSRNVLVLRQLRNRSQAYIIAVGPIDDSKLILRSLREGADEFLDENELETEFDGALERLTEDWSAQSRTGKTVAVLGPSGGSGTSTIAANLSVGLSRMAGSAALFDLDLQTGDLAPLMNLRPGHTLADFCQNIEHVNEEVFEKCMAAHKSGVALMPAPFAYHDLEAVTLQGIRHAMNMACDSFPYVVVDLAHTLSEEQHEIVQHADVILIAMRLEFTGLRNTYRMLEYLQYLGVKRDVLKVVVNRHGQPKEIPISKAEKLLGQPIFHYIPNDPKPVLQANNCGSPVILNSPWSRAGRSMAELSRRVHVLCDTAEEVPGGPGVTWAKLWSHQPKRGSHSHLPALSEYEEPQEASSMSISQWFGTDPEAA